MTRLENAIDAFAQPIGTDAIRIERVLPGPRERVWRYLTEPELRRRWLAAGAFDLAPNGAVELVFHNNGLTRDDIPPPAGYEAHGKESRLRGTILACDEPSLSPSPGDLSGFVRRSGSNSPRRATRFASLSPTLGSQSGP